MADVSLSIHFSPPYENAQMNLWFLTSHTHTLTHSRVHRNSSINRQHICWRQPKIFPMQTMVVFMALFPFHFMFRQTNNDCWVFCCCAWFAHFYVCFINISLHNNDIWVQYNNEMVCSYPQIFLWINLASLRYVNQFVHYFLWSV